MAGVLRGGDGMTLIDADQPLLSPPRPVGGRFSARRAAADLARWRQPRMGSYRRLQRRAEIYADHSLRSPPHPVGGRFSARPAAVALARWRHWLSETVGVREEKGRKRPNADMPAKAAGVEILYIWTNAN